MTFRFALLLKHQDKCYGHLTAIIHIFKALVFDAKNQETVTDNSFWAEYFMQPNIYFEQEQIIWFLKILPLVEQKRSKAKNMSCRLPFWDVLKRPCDLKSHTLMMGLIEKKAKSNLQQTLWWTSLVWKVTNGTEVKEAFPILLCSL